MTHQEPAVEPDCIVCRCEDVSLSEVLAATLPPEDPNVTQLKHQTRAGMGVCGGRTCRPVIAALLAGSDGDVRFRYRLPARNILAGELARTPLPEDSPTRATLEATT